MPYKNIHWVRLEKRLLNDPRFFLMQEKSQLYYIKLLLLCATYNNKVPRKYGVFKELLRTKCSEKELDEIFDEIKLNFPKVLLHKDYYYIKGFKQHHHWIEDREQSGTPKGAIINYIILNYIKLKKWEEQIKDPLIKESIFKRNVRPARDLARLNKDAEYLIRAMNHLAATFNNRGLEWTLETITKWYPDFLKKYPPENKTPQAMRELGKGIGEEKQR